MVSAEQAKQKFSEESQYAKHTAPMSAPQNLQRSGEAGSGQLLHGNIGQLKRELAQQPNISKFELDLPDFHNQSFKTEKQTNYLGL